MRQQRRDHTMSTPGHSLLPLLWGALQHVMFPSRPIVGACLVLGSLACCVGCADSLPNVSVLRVPDGGTLPQVAVDEADTIHLVYYSGSMSFGDLFHATMHPGTSDWSEPQRINSTPRSVTGLGPTDGGQFTIGPDGRLHVVWFHRAPPRFYYTRSDHTGRFETQKVLSRKVEDGVESGPTLAVDHAGAVYVFWHADPVEDAQRRVYGTVSRDNGVHFDSPRTVNLPAAGACACCGIRAVANVKGTISVAYRSAGDNVNRDMRLLTSTNEGRTFTDRLIQPWTLGACPVATTTLSTGPQGTVVGWETEGQVYLANTEHVEEATLPPGVAEFRRKNPTVAVNHRGQTLLAWGDGPGFQSGGQLYWHLFDDRGRPRGQQNSTSTLIPPRSLPSTAARNDGSFVLVY